MYNYGLIGNCQIAALVNTTGSIDWLCLPRPDSPPVFGRLLDEDGGHFSIETAGKSTSRQSYLPNTNILITHITAEDGSEFEITDFCPRFEQYGRMFRPCSLFVRAHAVWQEFWLQNRNGAGPNNRSLWNLA
ncbi:trehalase-like domain-containing protein, partial [Bdellovibrionota bacterium FG-2]